jgi:sortase (surface protein transpeptidase)
MLKKNKTFRAKIWWQVVAIWISTQSRQWLRTNFSMIGVALLLPLAISFISFRTNATAPIAQVQAEVTPTIQSEIVIQKTPPQTIKVANTTINLPIQPAAIKDGVWEVSNKAASHLDTSANPGEGGNIAIYGHNRPHLLKQLHNIDVGTIITIISEDQTEYEYTVGSIETLPPTDVTAVLPTTYEQLTIYTCTNFLDSDRLVVKAYLTRVTSSVI